MQKEKAVYPESKGMLVASQWFWKCPGWQATESEADTPVWISVVGRSERHYSVMLSSSRAESGNVLHSGEFSFSLRLTPASLPPPPLQHPENTGKGDSLWAWPPASNNQTGLTYLFWLACFNIFFTFLFIYFRIEYWVAHTSLELFI